MFFPKGLFPPAHCEHLQICRPTHIEPAGYGIVQMGKLSNPLARVIIPFFVCVASLHGVVD